MERERLCRLRHLRDRRRVRRSWLALRRILALHLGAEPADLRFEVGPHGRPELRPFCPAGTRFSLSRSGGLALVAVADGRAVGVDVEEDRPMADLGGVMTVACGARERAELAGLPAPARRAAFYASWTLKEARLKADGRGLTADPRSVPVPPRDAGVGRPWLAEGWGHLRLTPAPRHVGAVVARGSDWAVAVRDYGCLPMARSATASTSTLDTSSRYACR